MKTYVIIVSPRFPSNHPMKGQRTYFKEKIEIGLGRYEATGFFDKDTNSWLNLDMPKIHTIRKSYPLWEKRIAKVLKYEAEISLRYWKLPGGCYTKGNMQIEIARLSADDNVGIQEIRFYDRRYLMVKELINRKDATPLLLTLAKNDGLSLQDFKDWFKGYDLSKPMAIIHFTPFRY